MIIKIEASHRRNYLNQKIFEISKDCSSPILDIGGEKETSRNWAQEYIQKKFETIIFNIEIKNKPDVQGDASKLPFNEAQFQTIFCFEVLEHCKQPQAVLQEIYRVLSSNGIFFLSIPFLYPMHADPFDFQRWTDTNLKHEFTKLGFKRVKIEPMGGIFSSLNDILLNFCWSLKMPKVICFGILLIFRTVISPLLYFLDQKYGKKYTNFTGGYFVTAEK